MKILAIASLAVALLGASPHVVHEPTVAHEAACDWAYDHKTHNAADLCLLAADEWAAEAARYNRRPEEAFTEIMEALTRVQTSLAMKRIGNPNALSQMDLAVAITSGICKPGDEDGELRACSAIAHIAVKTFPQVYFLSKPK